ncbi:MAG: PAS domain S-box protein [bacterium]|nr:PAS domain S-box protein [bacterium]
MNVYFDKINKYRHDCGISVKGFAKLLDISRTSLWKWEKGQLVPSEKIVKKIANVLNVSISDISDIPETVQVSQHNFSGVVDSWLGLTEINDNAHQKQVSLVLDTIKNLNSKLNQSVLIIKALLDSMETMFYIKDSRLKYLTANTSFLKNISYDHDNPVLGKDDFTFFSNEEARMNTEEDRKVFQTGQAILRDERFIPGCRKTKWGIVSKLPVFDSENKIVGVIGTLIDITDRKKSEETRILLEKCINTITHVITIHDINSDSIIYVNKMALEHISGYPVKYFKGQKGREFLINKLCYPEDRQIITGPKEKTVWPKTTTLQYRIIRANGEIRYVESIDSYIKYSGIDCIVGITRDITEQKKKEIKQIDNNLKNEFLKLSPSFLWAGCLDRDNNFKFNYLSDEVVLITGYQKSELIDGTRTFESMLDLDSQTTFKKQLKSEETFENFEFTIITSENKTVKMKASILSKESHEGDIVYYGKAVIAS